ncbi:MAG: S8 family serine peptidase, partial [Lewinella sp.]|nr:S8 family serine peptidase [Lewinella sp.]
MNQVRPYSLLILLLLLSFVEAVAQISTAKISPSLLLDTEHGASVECIVEFNGKPDLSDLPAIHGKTAKGRAVFQRLQRLADSQQQEVRQILDRAAHPYRSFFVANAIYLEADRQLLQQLAGRPEVSRIQPNPWSKVLERQPNVPAMASARSPIDWGLEKIHVPEVWAQGINGTGVVIGGQDTGVEWTHPTLKEKYRGWQGNQSDAQHIYNWFDAITAINPLNGDSTLAPSNNPCGLSVNFPCDDNNHGTYTMGISVGDDGQGNQIGVAPGAQWIACRNMERGYGSPATYLACFEWFLAPTDLDGNDPKPELAPHVINNSWGCPTFEGCTIDNWGILETAVENLRAAGVVVIVSAGNDGPDCGSVNDPSAIFQGAFAVGATNSTDTLANFSSRGPVTVDGSGRIKPDVVAPGVTIRSARRNNAFAVSSGTS